MKAVLVIPLVISLWSYSKGYTTEEWTDLVRTLKAECKNETGIEDETIQQKVYQTDVIDKSDTTLLKYIQCIGTNGAFVDEEGNVNEGFIRTHLQNLGIAEDVITKTFQTCDKKSGDPPLKIAYYYECYRKFLPQSVFAV